MTTEAIAIGITVLNRLAITLVEAVLLGVGFVIWRVARPCPRIRAGPNPFSDSPNRSRLARMGKKASIRRPGVRS